MMTINEAIRRVNDGSLAAGDAARMFISRPRGRQAELAYPLKYFAAITAEEAAGLRAIRQAADGILAQEPEAPKRLEVIDEVRCSCGHPAPRIAVMMASRGTACPDCYDRLSD